VAKKRNNRFERALLNQSFKAITQYYKDFHFIVHKVTGSLNNRGKFYPDPLVEVGVTDLLGYHIPSSKIVFIELKIGDNDLTDGQVIFHNRVKLNKAYIKTCWSVREVADFLDQIRLLEQNNKVN
jgi:hypothetical protein